MRRCLKCNKAKCKDELIKGFCSKCRLAFFAQNHNKRSVWRKRTWMYPRKNSPLSSWDVSTI